MRWLSFFLAALFPFGGTLSLAATGGALNPSIETPVLTLYYAPWCYYSHKVLNYLDRIHKRVPLKDIQNPLYKEELIRLGGKRQIPCLIINQEALYESNEIIAWLSQHQDLLEDR
ncbi:MAG TPA: hypothetical protein DHV41_03775 [Parachlamydiales bacterium]|nr:hypothetical protein [Parachlamydiales bacterium]HCJ84498.1 hypothetical protein [Parachlamydiales bacterium]